MAYIDRSTLKEEFPFHGEFYTEQITNPDDGDMFGDAPNDTDDSVITNKNETIILSTDCDVIETNRSFANGTITAQYDVYFPIKDNTINIDRGMNFRCNTFGLNVSGIVISVGASLLGKAHAYIRCNEI